MDRKKEEKKKPTKTLKEKRAEKKAKKSNGWLLTSSKVQASGWNIQQTPFYWSPDLNFNAHSNNTVRHSAFMQSLTLTGSESIWKA
jgi:hypothetical protein